MSTFKEYANYDALALAELIKNKKITQQEVLQAAVEKVERLNPKLNAIIDFFPEEATQKLDYSLNDSLFFGVPFLLKDIEVNVEGHVTSHGSRLFKNNKATEDSEIVKRYRQSGLVIFGKTNTPEFGLNASTEGSLFGPCNNPWNLNYSTGGSSGGSAAAVAAGIVPMAHASDGGGSIRIPASCCGLFGLKPSRGMVSFAPEMEAWNGLDHMHVITRSVRDSAALLDQTAGYCAGDFHRVSKQTNSYSQVVENKMLGEKALKIAFSNTSPSGVALDADCIDAVEKAANLCEDLGHSVELAMPEYNAMDLAYHCALIGISNINFAVQEELLKQNRSLADDDVEIATRSLIEVMKNTSAKDYVQALHYLNQTSRQVARFFNSNFDNNHEHYDLWLSPTLAQAPTLLGHLSCKGEEDTMAFYDRVSSFTPFTGLANATGLPAMSVPLHWNKEGLPIGVQFVGRSGEEELMYALAGQLEEAQPWFNRYSSIVI